MASPQCGWSVTMTKRYIATAAELDELRAQRSQLNTAVKQRDKAEAEIERLRADLTREQGQRLCDNMKSVEENERLRAALTSVTRSDDHDEAIRIAAHTVHEQTMVDRT